jgi:arsenate reductase-like glutaredoxin family protein
MMKKDETMPDRTIEGTPVTNGDLVVILSQMQDQLDDLIATVEEQDRKLREVRRHAGLPE